MSGLEHKDEYWTKLKTKGEYELATSLASVADRKKITMYLVGNVIFLVIFVCVVAVVGLVALRIYNIRYLYPQLYTWWTDVAHGYRSCFHTAGPAPGYNGHVYSASAIALTITYPGTQAFLNVWGGKAISQNTAFFLLDMVTIFGSKLNGYAWAGVNQPKDMFEYCLHYGTDKLSEDQAWKRWDDDTNPFLFCFPTRQSLMYSSMWKEFQLAPSTSQETILFQLFHGGLCRYAYANSDKSPFLIMRTLFDSLWLPTQRPPDCTALINEAKGTSWISGLLAIAGIVATGIMAIGTGGALLPAAVAEAAAETTAAAAAEVAATAEETTKVVTTAAKVVTTAAKVARTTTAVAAGATAAGSVVNYASSVKAAKQKCKSDYATENGVELYNSCRFHALHYQPSEGECAKYKQDEQEWLSKNTDWGKYDP
jgi:hypothetical protein